MLLPGTLKRLGFLLRTAFVGDRVVNVSDDFHKAYLRLLWWTAKSELQKQVLISSIINSPR
jgi:hypothetical protein